MLGGLVLELGHAGHFAHVGKAVQDPAQLGVLGDLGLKVDDVFLRVEAAGQEERHGAQAGLAQLRGILAHRQCVEIHDGVEAVVLILKKGEVAQRADVIAQRQIARRLNAGENALLRNLLFHK